VQTKFLKLFYWSMATAVAASEAEGSWGYRDTAAWIDAPDGSYNHHPNGADDQAASRRHQAAFRFDNLPLQFASVICPCYLSRQMISANDLGKLHLHLTSATCFSNRQRATSQPVEPPSQAPHLIDPSSI